jgi:DNA-binding response OmpR family regulator
VKTVLIIDDEKDFAYFIQSNLQFLKKYKVYTALNGNSGIKKAARYRPDLILLDIVMPKMSGFEVLKELKANDKTLDIPVIMLTAKSDEKSVLEACGLYCEDYIVKPVKINALRSQLDEVMARFGKSSQF